MDEIQTLIGQMASDIAGIAVRLEPSRSRLFLEWLVSHSSKVQTTAISQLEINDGKQLESTLKAWFQSLPLTGLLWEYRLILAEVAWCHDFDPAFFSLQTYGEIEK
jgi:hypothetical protein